MTVYKKGIKKEVLQETLHYPVVVNVKAGNVPQEMCHRK